MDKINNNNLLAKIRDVPDFPKPGIMFKDITTLIRDKEAFAAAIDLFYQAFKDKKIDYVAAIESRGYIFGAPLAYKLGAGLVIIRKPGKLPAETIREDYALEYGTDALEIHKDAVEVGKKVLVVDDLLATGGTAAAACRLLQKCGAEVSCCAFCLELSSLPGRQNMPEGVNVWSALSC